METPLEVSILMARPSEIERARLSATTWVQSRALVRDLPSDSAKLASERVMSAYDSTSNDEKTLDLLYLRRRRSRWTL